jgi:hypothetical protein
MLQAIYGVTSINTVHKKLWGFRLATRLRSQLQTFRPNEFGSHPSYEIIRLDANSADVFFKNS